MRNCSRLVLSRENHVNLNAWITSNSHNNVGDYLSYVVVENMCKMHGIDFEQEISATKHLYAIGSILPGYQDAVVWGTGFGYDKTEKRYSLLYNWFHRNTHKLDIRAVRGPETKRILTTMGIKCPEIYGDPAVLMPLFYHPSSLTEQYEYLVIPHYSKYNQYRNCDCCISTFTADYKAFIDKICASKIVVSSSLHGIILAESYGIPAVLLKDTPSKDITKYKDWYYSTERYNFRTAESVEQALELGGTSLDHKTIHSMQARLIQTFPMDLWQD